MDQDMSKNKWRVGSLNHRLILRLRHRVLKDRGCLTHREVPPLYSILSEASIATHVE